MARDVFHPSHAIQVRGVFNGLLLNSSRFNWKLQEIITKNIGIVFNTKFREDNFIATLSDTVVSNSNLAKTAGFGEDISTPI